VKGRLHTRYAPVRRSLIPKNYTPRLACVKPAASVHPEPGSNSSSYIMRLIAQTIYFWLKIYRFILILLFYYSYSFVFEISLKNGCQFNMSTNVYFLFFPLLNSLIVSPGAVINSFTSHKLFWILFENKFSTPFSFACHYVKNLIAVAGAKVTLLFD
jgi:hypothetical protein